MRKKIKYKNILLFVSSFIVSIIILLSKGYTTLSPTDNNHNYLFVMSWSPTYCALKDPHNRQAQCAKEAHKKYRFIVHGLWPQIKENSSYEERLAYCKKVDRKLDADIVEKYFHIMPSSILMRHQWVKHASCGEFTQEQYFEKIGELYNRFNGQELFSKLSSTESFPLLTVVDSIVEQIPGLKRSNIVIRCQKNLLKEVRICLNSDYSLRDCEREEVRAGRCRAGQDIGILF